MTYSRRDALILAGHLGLASYLTSRRALAQAGKPNPFLEGGFAPVHDELDVDNLVVRGEIPREIAGTYLRNGPNPRPGSAAPFFAGDGMIHGVRLEAVHQLGDVGPHAGELATDFSGCVVRDNPEVNRRVAEMTALGRVGQPDDIGPMIAALLSEDNRWINGQRIEVSGGMAL